MKKLSFGRIIINYYTNNKYFCRQNDRKNEKTATRFGGNKRPDKNTWSNDI